MQKGYKMLSEDFVPILYNEITKKAKIDEIDVLTEVKAVETSLAELDLKTARLPFSEKTIGDLVKLKEAKPLIVFNLVESISGNERLSYLAPSILESLGLRYTGCSAKAIFLTADKITTKKLFTSCGIPTPSWFTLQNNYDFIKSDKFIIKRVFEDGSVDLFQESVVNIENIKQGQKILKKKQNESKNEFFAEKYIKGREINISLLEVAGKPLTLPPLEIKFVGYEENNKYEIQDYKSKWNNEELDYGYIESTNVFLKKDKGLIEVIKEISIKCWHEFELQGYARIDFRIDEDGNPWVLEINANPCISPNESSFIKSAEYGGFEYKDIIKKLIYK